MSRSLNTSMAAISSAVARPAASWITETRYCITNHLPVVWGRPSRAAAHPCYEHPRPDPTPPPGFLQELSGTPVELVDLICERPRLVVEVPHGPSVAHHAAADCGTCVTCFNRRWRLRTPGGQQADRSGWLCP